MLLFHGTGGERALVEQILEQGLLPHGGRAWAEKLTAIPEHVFLCTTPIGTRDGDPIRWAQGRAWKQRRAWLIVVDLPDARFDELVVGAIRNEDLTRFWTTQELVNTIGCDRITDVRRVHAHARQQGVAVHELVRLVVIQVADGLTMGRPPDAETLVQFEAAYYRASADRKETVARSYGLAIPEAFARDPHYPYCLGCGHQLFEVRFEIPDLRDERDRPLLFHRGAFTRLDRQTFGFHVDAVGRWLDACDPAALARTLAREPHLRLDRLAERFPPPADTPRTFSPDLLRGDLGPRAREPDTQLMLRQVPPELVVGAIDLGTRDRLSRVVRPNRGETLLDKLRFATSQLRARRERQGRAAILEA